MKKSTMRCEVLAIEGAANVRDLGGYEGTDGRRIKKRRFLRAAALDKLTRRGIRSLRDTGVNCIIDLRSRMEARRAPDPLEKDEHIKYYHVPMLDHIQSNEDGSNISMYPSSMAEMYRGLLADSGEDFRRVMEILAEPGNAACLFHCTAGKDRTGLIAMLLLGLAGVEREIIVEDYQWSEKLLYPLRFNPSPDLPRYLFQSKPETMRAAIGYLDESFGGIVQYLNAIGLTPAQKDALHTKLFG